MKILFNIKNHLLLLVILITLSGCDLEVQERFNFKPDVDIIDPFDDSTAWEWLQTRTSSNFPFILNEGEDNEEAVPADPQEFDYMLEAIKATGYIDRYNGSNTDRTYLLLNNEGFFNEDASIIELITGDIEVPDGETPAQTIARADLDILKKILDYHTLNSFVAQVPTLPAYNVDYVFQTLVPGDCGKIALRRDERYRIEINSNQAPLPSSATNREVKVFNHNYLFKNGIGHILNLHVRNCPYLEE